MREYCPKRVSRWKGPKPEAWVEAEVQEEGRATSPMVKAEEDDPRGVQMELAETICDAVELRQDTSGLLSCNSCNDVVCEVL